MKGEKASIENRQRFLGGLFSIFQRMPDFETKKEHYNDLTFVTERNAYDNCQSIQQYMAYLNNEVAKAKRDLNAKLTAAAGNAGAVQTAAMATNGVSHSAPGIGTRPANSAPPQNLSVPHQDIQNLANEHGFKLNTAELQALAQLRNNPQQFQMVFFQIKRNHLAQHQPPTSQPPSQPVQLTAQVGGMQQVSAGPTNRTNVPSTQPLGAAPTIAPSDGSTNPVQNVPAASNSNPPVRPPVNPGNTDQSTQMILAIARMLPREIPPEGTKFVLNGKEHHLPAENALRIRNQALLIQKIVATRAQNAGGANLPRPPQVATSQAMPASTLTRANPPLNAQKMQQLQQQQQQQQQQQHVAAPATQITQRPNFPTNSPGGNQPNPLGGTVSRPVEQPRPPASAQPTVTVQPATQDEGNAVLASSAAAEPNVTANSLANATAETLAAFVRSMVQRTCQGIDPARNKVDLTDEQKSEVQSLLMQYIPVFKNVEECLCALLRTPTRVGLQPLLIQYAHYKRQAALLSENVYILNPNQTRTICLAATTIVGKVWALIGKGRPTPAPQVISTMRGPVAPTSHPGTSAVDTTPSTEPAKLSKVGKRGPGAGESPQQPTKKKSGILKQSTSPDKAPRDMPTSSKGEPIPGMNESQGKKVTGSQASPRMASVAATKTKASRTKGSGTRVKKETAKSRATKKSTATNKNQSPAAIDLTGVSAPAAQSQPATVVMPAQLDSNERIGSPMGSAPLVASSSPVNPKKSQDKDQLAPTPSTVASGNGAVAVNDTDQSKWNRPVEYLLDMVDQFVPYSQEHPDDPYVMQVIEAFRGLNSNRLDAWVYDENGLYDDDSSE
ncbi:hypothetical protein IWQ61_002906 [Dispira simplex]|nr:hypothetical protein IWQ61_002906 [Dispira simplex]